MAEKCLTPSHDQNPKSWSKVCSGMLWDRVRRLDHDLTSLGVCRGVRVAARRLFARLRTYFPFLMIFRHSGKPALRALVVCCNFIGLI